MSKTRILVVEDESIVAKDIQRTLEKLGYEVPATASSAASAFESQRGSAGSQQYLLHHSSNEYPIGYSRRKNNTCLRTFKSG